MLSIQQMTVLIGIFSKALQASLAVKAAFCPLTSSSLGVEVFLFENLDMEVSRTLALFVPYSTTAIVSDEQALSLASENVQHKRFNFPVYKGPVKLIQWVKIAHSFSQSVSNLFHSMILSLPVYCIGKLKIIKKVEQI